MREEIETVIIGSGFGGAFAAKQLTDSGRNVLMLERGPWRDTIPNQSVGLSGLESLPQGLKTITHSFRSFRSFRFKNSLILNPKGFIEAYQGKGINVICSSSVGGGSHIYAAMLAKPASPDYWDHRDKTITAELMDGYYQRVISTLNARAVVESDRVPNNINETNYDGILSTHGLANPLIGIQLPEIPGSPKKITLQSGVERWECDYKNNSILGSYSGAKTTLDFSVLFPATEKGLTVRDMCEVISIEKIENAVNSMRYEVRYKDHRAKKVRSLYAQHVILAAGCINTVSLLLKAREKGGLKGMPRLGYQFGTNGGFFGIWRENSSRDLSVGLPLSGPFRAQNSESKSVQVLRAAIQGMDGVPLPSWLKRWTKKNAFIVALGKDNNDGVIELRKGKLHITYDKYSNDIYKEIDNEVRDIKRLTKTKIFAPKSPLTVQPLGGACLGNSILDGVIGANGEIFDNPGIYIVDASALPESPGRPPSLTIAAWATLVADRLAATIRAESDF